MQPIEFFEIGKTIKRIRKDIATGTEKVSYIPITNKKDAQYYYGMQSDLITFEKNEPRSHGYKADEGYMKNDNEPLIRIHRSGLEGTCLACEG